MPQWFPECGDGAFHRFFSFPFLPSFTPSPPSVTIFGQLKGPNIYIIVIDPSEGREEALTAKKSHHLDLGPFVWQESVDSLLLLHPTHLQKGCGVFGECLLLLLVLLFIYLFTCLLASASCALQHLFQATCLSLTVPTWAKLGHATG